MWCPEERPNLDQQRTLLEQVKFIQAKDLQTIDALWRAASGGKFGYSVQKELWIQNRRYWEKFFKAIDWVQVLPPFMPP